LTSREGTKFLRVLDRTVTNIIDADAAYEIDRWTIKEFLIPIRRALPRELGIRPYNESLEELCSEGKKATLWKSKKERDRVLAEFEKYVRTFRAMTDRAVGEEKPTDEDLKILKQAFATERTIVARGERGTGRFHPALSVVMPRLEDYLWMWVAAVWWRAIEVRRCKARDCNKIFLPRRSDRQYCSTNCRTRAFHQRKRSSEAKIS